VGSEPLPLQRTGEGSVFDDLPAARSWYLRARMAEARGDLAEADRAMGWVLRQGRGWADSWVEVGDYRVRTGRADDAVDPYLEALERSPDHPGAHLGLARAWLATGHLGEAWASVQAARAAGAEGVEAVAVAVALRRGEPLRALEVLERWVSQPATGAERLARAEAALQVGWADPAVDDLLHLVDHLTLGPEARQRLPAAAAAACRAEEVAAVVGSGPSSSLPLGDWLAAGRHAEVLKATEGTRDPTAGWARAGALVALQRVEEAEQVVVETARSPADGARRLARLRQLLGDEEGAAEALADLPVDRAWLHPEAADFEALTESHPTSGMAWLGRAWAGDPDAVSEALRFGACEPVALAATAERLGGCASVPLYERLVRIGADPTTAAALQEARVACGEGS
jgi:tetratricopeptide (TPR) repeat protein